MNKQISFTTRLSQNVNESKNRSMNKSAILINKWQLQLAQQLPKYVTGRKKTKMKTININKGLTSQGVKNKSLHKILQASIKQAFKSHENSRNNSYNKRSTNKSKCQTSKNTNEIKTKSICKPYPRPITNILYRQNIKNYNPYILVLEQLQRMQNYDESQKQKIKRLCYIGIARNYFQSRKYFMLPQYSRVGMLIRTYMVQVMHGHLEQKIQNQPNSVFVKINQTALSFNPYDRPKQLQDHISKRRYTEIIRGGNKIIQQEYQKYKKSNFQSIGGNFTYSEIFLYAIVAIIIIVVMIYTPSYDNQSWIIFAGFGGVLLTTIGGMLMSWIQCNRTINKVCPPGNITRQIQAKLKNYFKKISDQTLIWKVGTDFYWIQIENIKIKKRKNQQNNDNF